MGDTHRLVILSWADFRVPMQIDSETFASRSSGGADFRRHFIPSYTRAQIVHQVSYKDWLVEAPNQLRTCSGESESLLKAVVCGDRVDCLGWRRGDTSLRHYGRPKGAGDIDCRRRQSGEQFML